MRPARLPTSSRGARQAEEGRFAAGDDERLVRRHGMLRWAVSSADGGSGGGVSIGGLLAQCNSSRERSIPYTYADLLRYACPTNQPTPK